MKSSASLKLTLAAIMGASLAAPLAAHADGRWDHDRWDRDQARLARVVQVQPIVRTVRVVGPAQQYCTTRSSGYERRGDAAGATLAGGIIGGVIGSRLGDDGGNPVATVAGAIIGGAIGHTLAQGGVRDARSVTVCEPVRAMRRVEQVRGYRVTYRYHGRLFVTRMHSSPGRFLRVNWDGTPLY